jgi:hypothetical protein
MAQKNLVRYPDISLNKLPMPTGAREAFFYLLKGFSSTVFISLEPDGSTNIFG